MPRRLTIRRFITVRSGTRRTTATALAILLAVLGLAGVVAPVASAAAPIVIDDFAGNTAGPRTVTPLPLPNTSTTAPGQFSQAGGVATMTMNGNGNGQGGVQLDYVLPSLDLTSDGNNTQFFLVFNSIQRLPEIIGQSAAIISIQLTGGGVTGSYSTGVANTGPFNIVLNFSCAANPVCFTPQPDFTKVTHVTVSILYPQNDDPDHSLTAVLDSINTTPTGGAVPPPAAAAISGPAADPDYGPTGTTLQFPLSFTSNGQPATVFSKATAGNLRASDVSVSGTAAGVGSVALSGSGANYTITVGPLTGAGTVVVSIAAGAAVDTWAQPTLASNVFTVNFAIPVPPAFTGSPPPAATVGTAYSYQFTAGGVPAATYSLTSGTLPAGLALGTGGALTGTPATGTGGTYPLTVTAANTAGSVDDAVTLTVDEPSAFTNGTPPAAVVGSAYSFAFTTRGFPVPTLTETGALPTGMAFDAATGTLAGTPASGTGGTYPFTVHSTSTSGSADDVTSLTVFEAPAITSPASASFDVGVAGSFTITTDGFAVPSVSLSGALPAGLQFTANPDGTATISGTPLAAGAGSATVTVTATNQTAPVAMQQLTIDVSLAPTITSAATTIFVVATAGTFTVTATGSPTPALAVTGTLPSGLTFVDNGDGTATLSGTPDAGSARDYTLQVSATSGAQAPVTQTLTVKVKQAPAFTSAATATFQVGVAGTFVITASGVPTPSFTLTGALPSGLSFADNGDGTASISGTPDASAIGTTSVTINVANDLTDPSQTLGITVLPAAALAFTPGTDDGGTLAFTGTDLAPVVGLAVGLLGVGAVALVGAGRRRRRTPA